jgi:hypothetical protein
VTLHAKRRDANERIVIDALKAVGATVLQLDGKGVPDLLVGYHGATVLIEVKNPDSKSGAKPGEIRRKGRGVLKPSQVKTFGTWTGGKIHEVISADEALVAIGALP